jgi:hypothetical protein
MAKKRRRRRTSVSKDEPPAVLTLGITSPGGVVSEWLEKISRFILGMLSSGATPASEADWAQQATHGRTCSEAADGESLGTGSLKCKEVANAVLGGWKRDEIEIAESGIEWFASDGEGKEGAREGLEELVDAGREIDVGAKDGLRKDFSLSG